jgi:hypothetical protein
MDFLEYVPSVNANAKMSRGCNAHSTNLKHPCCLSHAEWINSRQHMIIKTFKIARKDLKPSLKVVDIIPVAPIAWCFPLLDHVLHCSSDLILKCAILNTIQRSY